MSQPGREQAEQTAEFAHQHPNKGWWLCVTEPRVCSFLKPLWAKLGAGEENSNVTSQRRKLQTIGLILRDMGPEQIPETRLLGLDLLVKISPQRLSKTFSQHTALLFFFFWRKAQVILEFTVFLPLPPQTPLSGRRHLSTVYGGFPRDLH